MNLGNIVINGGWDDGGRMPLRFLLRCRWLRRVGSAILLYTMPLDGSG